ncbi:TPA_asm: hypothetical protein HUJ06_031883 [Nelumbo nucifera]|uniref:Uncharacterized protein n=1 Tax=Nelumbo nucifera TaxID=4432 RepID=A0A822ZYI6_NELNU|nr:TPA_asm: hypothetical protein HUJ06_031883 [Nelumbo nucifera]
MLERLGSEPPLAPEPAELPHADPDRERAEQLLRSIQAQLTEGFRRYFERPVGRVSSHFPETQSFYSTLAKQMMEQDLGLSADDDVHSLRECLDALNENKLSI